MLHEGVDVRQKREGILGSWTRRRDQFDQRLGIIGGDPGMGERGTQARRVRRLSDFALWGKSQAFLFQAFESAAQPLMMARANQPVQPVVGTHVKPSCKETAPERRWLGGE